MTPDQTKRRKMLTDLLYSRDVQGYIRFINSEISLIDTQEKEQPLKRPQPKKPETFIYKLKNLFK